eukprot:CCRYP_013373-RD/>CCRYP_013373-RD protein AED:0.41 eAED:0.41 QI:0/-1/0/1/-1/0/1/0/71
MPATSPIPMHEARPAAIFSFLTMPQFHPIMVPSSTLPTSSNTSWHQPRRPNLAHSTSLRVRQSASASFLKS